MASAGSPETGFLRISTFAIPTSSSAQPETAIEPRTVLPVAGISKTPKGEEPDEATARETLMATFGARASGSETVTVPL